MKIAFPNDNGQINQHFGRSREFAILEVENGKVVSRKIVSAQSLQHDHQGLADLLAGENVEVVILGGIGPYALQALESKGFKVITGASGDIDTTGEQYARGELVSRGAVCGHHHHSHTEHNRHGHGCHHQYGHCGHHHD
ncbi:MAG: NifB/NifX family molybdenum-iron cluster-binding protein [Bacillota bacterium]